MHASFAEYDQDGWEVSTRLSPIAIAEAYRIYSHYADFRSPNGMLEQLVDNHDWAGVVDSVHTYGTPGVNASDKTGVDTLNATLRKVSTAELAVLYDHLEYAGGNLELQQDSRHPFAFAARSRAQVHQEARYTEFQAVSAVSSKAREAYIASLDTNKAAELHSKLASQIREALSTLPPPEGVHTTVTASQLQTYDTLREVGYGWYYETVDDIRNMLVNDAKSALEGASEAKAAEAVETLAIIDGQYVAHYLQSDTIPSGVDRRQLVDALARHDSELLIHLTHEGTTAVEEAARNLPSLIYHQPAEALNLVIAVPELSSAETIDAIGAQLSLNQLYQAAQRSETWNTALRTSPAIRAHVEHHIAKELTGTEDGPLGALRILSRYSTFPGVEHMVATQKHDLLTQLVSKHSLTSMEDEGGVTSLHAKAIATKIPELNLLPEKDLYYLSVLTYLQKDISDDELFEVGDRVFSLRHVSTPAEQTVLAKSILERVKPFPRNANEEYSLLDAADAITFLLPPDSEPDEETKSRLTELGYKLLAIDTSVENPDYAIQATVASLLNRSKDKELAVLLAERLSGENTTLLLDTTYFNDTKYVGWMMLLTPSERASLLRHCENPAMAILRAHDLLSDEPAERTAVIGDIVRKHPELRSFAAPAGIATWQRLSDLQAYPTIPSEKITMAPILRLERTFGEAAVRTIMKDIALDHLTGPHAEKLMSVLQFSLARNNALDAQFSIKFALKLLQQGCDADLIIDTIQTMPQHLADHTDSFYLDYTPYSIGDNATPEDSQKHGYKSAKTRKREKDIAAYNEEALLRLQHHTTGMTRDDIHESLRAFPKVKYGSENSHMSDIVQLGYFGPKFHTFHKNRHAILELLAQESVVDDSLDVTDILESDDIATTLSVLHRNASELSTSAPPWERQATIAADLIVQANLQGGTHSREDLYVPTAAGPQKFSEVDSDTYRAATARTLERALDIPTSVRRQTSARNMQTADYINRGGPAFTLPPGTLLHETTAVGKILATANLAGELTGTLSLDSDSYPGFVDTLKIDATWGETTTGNFAMHPNRYGLNKSSVLVYFPDQHIDAQPTNSLHAGHHLTFAGIPNTALGLILHYNEDPESLQEITDTQIEAGLYVPVVDKDGKLLFSADEYQERSRALKRFAKLNDLVEANYIYEPELYENADPGGIGSIAAHMEHSVRNAETMLAETDVSSELRTIVRAAMKLHDTGKLDAAAQEYSNVVAARKYLAQVDDIGTETKRKVLLLIRNDELLGEVLKSFDPNDENYRESGILPRRTRAKLDQFNRVFSDEALRTAALVVYQADVAAKRAEAWEEWELDQKLAALGLPNYHSALRRPT